MRQSHGDGNGHQQRRAPLPEPDQRDQDDQGDRLIERVHEQVDVFLDLQGLVGGANDHQVARNKLLDGGEFCVNTLAKFADLLAGTHENRKGDGAAAVPLPFLIAPVVIVQILRRALVAAADLNQVAEINGAARGGHSGDYVTDISDGLEFAGGINDDILAIHLECTAGQRNIARLQDALKLGRLQAVIGQALLGILR